MQVPFYKFIKIFSNASEKATSPSNVKFYILDIIVKDQLLKKFFFLSTKYETTKPKYSILTVSA